MGKMRPERLKEVKSRASPLISSFKAEPDLKPRPCWPHTLMLPPPNHRYPLSLMLALLLQASASCCAHWSSTHLSRCYSVTVCSVMCPPLSRKLVLAISVVIGIGIVVWIAVCLLLERTAWAWACPSRIESLGKQSLQFTQLYAHVHHTTTQPCLNPRKEGQKAEVATNVCLLKAYFLTGWWVKKGHGINPT